MTTSTTFGQDLDQMRRRSREMSLALYGIDQACVRFLAVASAPPPQPPVPQASVAETVQSFGQPPVPPSEQPLASALAGIRRRLTGQPAPSPDLQQSGPPVEERFVRPGDVGKPRAATGEGAQS